LLVRPPDLRLGVGPETAALVVPDQAQSVLDLQLLADLVEHHPGRVGEAVFAAVVVDEVGDEVDVVVAAGAVARGAGR